jgi:hypothetical protein
MKSLFSVNEVNDLISQGSKLLVAGDESLLNQVTRGNWIGGTSVYFITAQGGLKSRDLLFVQEVPEYCKDIKIMQYDEKTLSSIYNDAYDNGFTIILIPRESDVHFSYAVNVVNYPSFAFKPLIGWVTGVALEESTDKRAKVFDGSTKTSFINKAVALHVELPENKIADIDVYNLLEGGKDEITFQNTSFSVSDAYINGKLTNFYEYVVNNEIDIRYPIVGEARGMITVCAFRKLNQENKTVSFYAPVFKNAVYKFAKSTKDYLESLLLNMPEEKDNILFPCICHHHYTYGKLEGRIVKEIPECPSTFGEIAHILLNQTLVCLRVYEK